MVYATIWFKPFISYTPQYDLGLLLTNWERILLFALFHTLKTNRLAFDAYFYNP